MVGIINEMKSIALYVHIPFCIRKCEYCDFNSYPLDENLASEYLVALALDMELSSRQIQGEYKMETLYLGGGTPTCLRAGQLRRLIEQLYNYFEFEEDFEFTIEANPGTVDKGKLSILKATGVNRLSFGVQSFSDDLLKRIGRINSAEEAKDSYFLARQLGFTNLNLDFIFALPAQTLDIFCDTLEQAIELNPEHISLYNLTLEEGTPLYRHVRRGDTKIPDEDTQLAMYEVAIDRLIEVGYEHYEISNFAREGYRSRHNQIYWRNEEYLGLGAGAYSYLDGCRFYREEDPRAYISILGREEIPKAGEERLTKREKMGETIMLALRVREGMKLAHFRKRFGLDVDEIYKDVIDKWVAQGLLIRDEESIRLSRRGIYLADVVMSDFL